MLWLVDWLRAHERKYQSLEGTDVAPKSPVNLNSSVDFSRRDAEAQRMLDICVILPLRPKQNSITNLHLLGEKQQCASNASKLL